MDIRKVFLDYFKKHDHLILPSSGLIPQEDPSVLLTTAGMQQFRPYYLGIKKPPAKRIATVQKCFRTSDIWKENGISSDKIYKFGKEENFWGPAGETGPCGPCSEIYYDFGKEYGCGKKGCDPNCDCGRFLEVWNLVFK